MTGRAVVGIDVGGTKIKAYLRGDDFTSAPIERPTPQAGGASVVAALGDMHDELAAAYPGCNVQAVGIGAAGLVDPERGFIVTSTGHIPGWQDTPVKAPLEARLGVPVAVGNDVNAFALGEMTDGGGRGHTSALCVAVGTGVGGALVLNGDIWTGAHYLAGEAGYLFAGYIDGEPTILEHRAGGRGLETAYQTRTDAPTRLSLREISRRATEDNDPHAVAVVTEGATALGTVLGTVMTFFDPDILIVGGGVPQIGELWWQPFLAAVQAAPLYAMCQTPVARAQLGTDAVMVGAAVLARKLLG